MNSGVPDEAWMALFQQLPASLEKLDVGDNELPDRVVAALAAALAARGVKLDELFLDGNLLSDIAPVLPCCGALKELDIGDNQLTDAAARAIADRLPSWPLETLVLGSNAQLTAAGVLPVIYALPKSKVTTLYLDNTRVENTVLQALAQILAETQLEELHVDNTKVGDEGILELCKAIPQSSLRCLDICDNDLSDEVIAAIQAAIGEADEDMVCQVAT